MNFAIQFCSPALPTAEMRCYPDLAAAIEAIFPMDTEDAILLWNRVPVRIGYKYDLSVIIDDLLPLLDKISGTDVGSYEVHWGSDTFRANWSLQWEQDTLRIDSAWHSVLGDYEELLNKRSHLETSLRLFVEEWTKFVRKVRICVERSEATFADATAWGKLCEVADREPRPVG